MRRITLTAICLFSFCAASTDAFALTRDDVLFYAPFDGSAQASLAKGDAKPASDSVPQFVAGHSGQGLLTGGSKSEVLYSTAGNIDLQAGAVSLWIKPTDWSTDSHMRWFFRIGEGADSGGTGEGDFLWLYKFFQYSVYWLVQQDRPQRQVYLVAPASLDVAGSPPFDWKAGEWSHLIASWSGNQMNLYINGKFINSCYVPTATVLRRFAPTFQIGGQNQREGGTMDTVIDDLLILRRPVTPGEAQALYAKGLQSLDTPVPLDPLLQVSGGYMPSNDNVMLKGGLVGLRPDELSGLQLRYSIMPENGAEAIVKGEAPFDHVQQIIQIPAKKLPHGRYTLKASLVGREQSKLEEKLKLGAPLVLPSGKSSFTKSPKAEWQGNRIGYVKGVPAPWTGIVKSGDGLNVWGRRYEWGKSAFPTQITAAGQKLLARPIALRGTVDGKTYHLTDVAVKWEKITSERAEWSVAATLGGLPVQVKSWMEYDGFIWSKASVGNEAAFAKRSLTALELEIPFQPEAATLMQHRAPAPASGKVTSFRTALTSTPSIWLGNETAGLKWTTDDLNDWRLNDSSQMLNVEVGAKETLLRLKLVDGPVKASGALEYTVGLQATPVKPLDSRRRTWEMQMSGINATPARHAWVPYWQQWNRRTETGRGPYGYQVPGPGTLTDLKEFERQNKSPLIYWNLHGMWPADPVLQTYGGEWNRQYDADADPFYSIITDLGTPSLRDYLVWRNWKTLKDTPALANGSAGLYIDVAQAAPQLRRQADGTQLAVFETLAVRELQKRTHFMLKEWPDKVIVNHQSGDINMEQLAFSDILLTGEHLADDASLNRDLNYFQTLDLGRMRAEFSAQQYGIPMIFLPEIGRVAEGDPERHQSATDARGIPAAEHLCGLLWTHDVIPYIAYVNEGVFKQAARAKDAFGWDAETQFLGYWQNGALVQCKTDSEQVVTSVFLRRGKVLFVTMNNSDEDAKVELRPNWKTLQVKSPDSLIDAYAEQAEPSSGTSVAPVPLRDGSASYVVKARNFRALVAR